MSVLTIIKKIHKWLALLIGLQLLLWMLSGLVFNLLSHNKVSGSELIKKQQDIAWIGNAEDFVEIKRRYDQIISITTTQLQQSSVYRVKTKAETFILNPDDLSKIEVGNLLVREIARTVYIGQGELINASLITKENNQNITETRKFKLPVWKIDFSDNENSSLYISASTGSVLDIKTDTWRIFDFFWMLHIMDYSQRDDMNNALVIFAAALTSFIGLSGLWLLFSVFSFKDFNFLAKRHRVPLLISTEQGETSEFFVTKNSRLIDALANDGFQLPSNCGGGGSCGLCKVQVDTATPITAADNEQLTKQQIDAGYRLACQIKLASGLKVVLPSQVSKQQLLSCRVKSSQFKTPFIKEIILEVPQDSDFTFNAGEYILLHIPKGKTQLKQIELDETVKPYWDKLKINQLSSLREVPITRSYSMANPPVDNNLIILNVRIALPEKQSGDNRKGESGKASSYLFSLKKNDCISVSGPFGHFHAVENDNEMVFIGGGAGMAPLRSHIMHQLDSLKTNRKISFWYGARNQVDIFYQSEFEKRQKLHANFSWQVALSEDQQAGQWTGYTGFIHEVIKSNYLDSHKNLQACDFYICGPPLMNQATLDCLVKLGVKSDNIHIDDFGI
jgi:Na(+)-translocating NADH:ubiquinone oxidoreductase F subunit